MDLLTVDGTGISAWSATVSKKPDWLALPAATVDEQALGSGLGAVFGDPLTGARPLSFSLLVRAASESALGTAVRAATQALYRRDVVLVQSIRSTKQIGFRCLEVQEKQVGARDLMRSTELTFVGKCQDPRWRATSSGGLTAVSTTPVAIPLGSAPVEDWIATFHGASTNAQATIKNGGGTTLFVFGWTGALTSGQSLIADASQWITTQGGLYTPMNTWAGDYPILDPRDTPTIQVNSGTLDLAFAAADWEY